MNFIQPANFQNSFHWDKLTAEYHTTYFNLAMAFVTKQSAAFPQKKIDAINFKISANFEGVDAKQYNLEWNI